MYDLLQRKLGGLKGEIADFSQQAENFTLTHYTMPDFKSLLLMRMKKLGFDKVFMDKAGNIIGIIKGYGKTDPFLAIAHMDLVSGSDPSAVSAFNSNLLKFKAGVITSLYSAALLKRSLLPLKGDFIVAFVPRVECCDYNIKCLFDETLKPYRAKLSRVLLNEPTDFNLNLGHKGRMEYEIVVKTRLNRQVMVNRGATMLGAMFPLIHELEKHATTLPSDFILGHSSLKIKDVSYGVSESPAETNEFRVIVDRAFIPEEDQKAILECATNIARSVYQGDGDVSVSATPAREKIKTYTGFEAVTGKEFRPWKMESCHPFVIKSMEVLRENKFDSSVGYWKNIITEGSYTCGELNIPTIGFGAGLEAEVDSNLESLSMDKIEKAVVGEALIVHRNTGLPSIGWSSDEI